MAAEEVVLFPSQARSNVPGKVTFILEVTYGSSAVSSAKGMGLQLEDTDTGKMTVGFPRTFRRLTGFRWGWKKEASGAVLFPVIVDGTTVSDDNGSGKGELVVETRTEAGTATDPTSGDILLLEFDVTNDELDDGYAITVTTP